jgi:hypothetical protein
VNPWTQGTATYLCDRDDSRLALSTKRWLPSFGHRGQELLTDLPIRELRKVFTPRIKRLVDVNKGDGSYISSFLKFVFVNCDSMHHLWLPQRLIDHLMTSPGVP